ncbi:MAG: hypothetical protein RL417_21 [Pseudomonadota bacterium]|jgi:hypothetical protein
MPTPINDRAPEDPRRFFQLPERPLSEAEFPPSEMGRDALRIVREIASLRDSISFAELKRRAEYLAGEPLSRDAPGLWTYDFLVRVDPQPIETPCGQAFGVYRFGVNRLKEAPQIVTCTSFERGAVQFESGAVLDERAINLNIQGTLLHHLPLRVEPGGSLTFTRGFLGYTYLEIADAEERMPAHLFEVSRLRIGTGSSLELSWLERLIRPLSIIIENRGCLDARGWGELHWVRGIVESGGGEVMKVAFDVQGRGIGDSAVTIRNEGNVAFHIRQSLAWKI